MMRLNSIIRLAKRREAPRGAKRRGRKHRERSERRNSPRVIGTGSAAILRTFLSTDPHSKRPFWVLQFGSSKARFARPGPTRPDPARPGPARPGPARPAAPPGDRNTFGVFFAFFRSCVAAMLIRKPPARPLRQSVFPAPRRGGLLISTYRVSASFGVW